MKRVSDAILPRGSMQKLEDTISKQRVMGHTS